jgi:hypothetical protein
MEKIINMLEEKLNPEYMNSVYTWHQIKSTLQNFQSDLVMIKIDGIPFLVKPVITFSQLKRMIGADNDYYKIECINKPERWEDKIVAENELIDLNQPDCKNLEFKCVGKF